MKKATESLDRFSLVSTTPRETRKKAKQREAVPEVMSGFLVRSIAIKGRFIQTFGLGPLPILRSAMRSACFQLAAGGKKKPYLEKWDTEARYALIVTIKAPGVEVDIYTPVEAKIAIAAEIG